MQSSKERVVGGRGARSRKKKKERKQKRKLQVLQTVDFLGRGGLVVRYIRETALAVAYTLALRFALAHFRGIYNYIMPGREEI